MVNLLDDNGFNKQLLILLAELRDVLQNNNGTATFRTGHHRQHTHGQEQIMHIELLAFRCARIHNHAHQGPINGHIIGTTADKLRNFHHIKHMLSSIIGRNNQLIGIHHHNTIGGLHTLIMLIANQSLMHITNQLHALGDDDFIRTGAFKANGGIAAASSISQGKNLHGVKHAQLPFPFATHGHIFHQSPCHQRLLHHSHPASGHIRTNAAPLRVGLLLFENG